MIPPIGIGPLGLSEWSVSGAAAGSPAGGAGNAPASGSGSFAGALANAIGSLNNTQTAASQATQDLITGQATDPTQAVSAVENASLSMDYAAQIRNQIDTAATTLFQTQV